MREHVGKEKTRPSSELGDKNASCSEHRGPQPLGVDGSIYAGGYPVRA